MLYLDSVRNLSVGYRRCFSQPHWNIVVVVVHTRWFWYSTYRIWMTWWFLSHTLLHSNSNSNWDTISMYIVHDARIINIIIYLFQVFFLYSFASLFLRKHLCFFLFASQRQKNSNKWLSNEEIASTLYVAITAIKVLCAKWQ